MKQEIKVKQKELEIKRAKIDNDMANFEYDEKRRHLEEISSIDKWYRERVIEIKKEEYELLKEQEIKPKTDIKPVSVYTDENGEKWVRVRTLDEDFLLGIHDMNIDGKTEFEWEEMGNNGGDEIPVKKQWAIVAAYKDEVNEAMKEAGGEELEGCYWSDLQFNSYTAWFYGSNIGSLNFDFKYNTYHGRSLAYTPQN